MAHWSRLGQIVIECHTDHVEHAAGFWSEALGRPSEIDEDANCARLIASDGSTSLIIQGVHETPAIHVDIETGDLQAEVRRLTSIGAQKVGVVDHAVIMEAPTGHRFRVTSTASRVFLTATTGRRAPSRIPVDAAPPPVSPPAPRR